MFDSYTFLGEMYWPVDLLSSDNFRVSIPQFFLLILLLLEFLSGDILPILEHYMIGYMPATFIAKQVPSYPQKTGK